MRGGLAQLLALDFPDRVLSLVLMSTSPVLPGERDLPGSDASLRRFLATAEVDWSDEGSLLDYLVNYWRALWGAERHPLGSIAAPTRMIHGTADPMFPLAHGAALAAEIPGARLLALQGAGHCVDPADWEATTHAILDHTAV